MVYETTNVLDEIRIALSMEHKMAAGTFWRTAGYGRDSYR